MKVAHWTTTPAKPSLGTCTCMLTLRPSFDESKIVTTIVACKACTVKIDASHIPYEVIHGPEDLLEVLFEILHLGDVHVVICPLHKCTRKMDDGVFENLIRVLRGAIDDIDGINEIVCIAGVLGEIWVHLDCLSHRLHKPLTTHLLEIRDVVLLGQAVQFSANNERIREVV